MREEMSRTKYYRNCQEPDSPVSMFIVIIIFGIITILSIYTINKTPLVYVSASTGECVEVQNGKCSDIDLENDIYETIWVK